ncbi:Replication-relaxation [Amycolatopsis pretoriensis]|uniref:Replication-relaxation n=1 Tax=Amycolatopsis pretoriensis TaxID=218821 RepID=A0A1H5RI24_9PSEU|nr:replication-relaxation family protein [Amycolatopsis pretoriensis]SEF37141.1 Replication-relaxation [Amycolatopsis pretoriensis]
MDVFQREALTVLYWHRLASTEQVRRLVAPTLSPVTVRAKLAGLRRAGLADRITREHRPRTWHVTPAGAETIEAAGTVDARAYRLPGTAVAHVLQEHTLDVIETGLAFVETARVRGHECGPLSWTPEVAHQFRDRAGDRRGVVIADAVLHYVLEEAGRRTQRTLFVELDRATMPVARLARKLVGYIRYHDHTPAGASRRPAWRERYPRFPRVLIVLSGAEQPVLERRLADLRAHAQAMPAVSTAAGRVDMVVTTLPQLREHGPLAPVAMPLLGDPRWVSVFGRLS